MKKFLWVALAAIVGLARQPGGLTRVYAEDGTIFLADAQNLSTVDALTRPYAGYLHTVPRLLAELVPLKPAAAVLAVLAAVVTALLAWLVYEASGDHLKQPLQRLLVAAVVVLVPVGQDELPNTIANLHWPALYALFWVLLWKSGNPWVKGIVTLLIALSDILVVVFIPLLLWLNVPSRTAALGESNAGPSRHVHRDWRTAAAFGVGLTAQVAANLLGEGRELHLELVRWAPWYAIRAVPPGLLGERFFQGSDVDTRWLLFAALAWVLLAAVILWSWRTGDKKLAGLAALHSVALYALPVVLSGQATPRYAAAPVMLLIAALVALMREHTWVLACFLAFVWIISFHLPSARSSGPEWTPACGTVAIAPEGWKMELRC